MNFLLRRRNILVLLAIVLLSALYIFLDHIHFGCIFQRFLHIPCPGCGMTRALKALLALDFKAAFSYHPMVFSLPLVVGYIVKNGRLFCHRGFNIFILVMIGTGFLINYVIRLAALAR